MNTFQSGQIVINNTEEIISEINTLIHVSLDAAWMANGWRIIDSGASNTDVHPLINTAYLAYQHINQFIKEGNSGITPEIFEITEIAMKINALRKNNVPGLQTRLTRLMSPDFTLYRTARYEIQIAGMLLSRGHQVEFIEEGKDKTPDILVTHPVGKAEIECKHKEPMEDQLDYVKSIYNNTQTARRQFSKEFPGVIFIEIDRSRFDEFQTERARLEQEIFRALRNSSSISAILLTSKINLEDNNDYILRHRVAGFSSKNARHSIPDWLSKNLANH
ncbi:MAG: hypothetical protein DCC56_07785 [Anaerolineae bacterium]|nr:MAG: hypothetical protein DCC56_07785 [Anaerolineae bacterium]WKZ45512.1 MAG: hypothetical protein QY302_06945 [Anaerolineales bacterium]